MQIYPAIDMKDGKCVRLQQGRFDEVTVFHDNPAVVAKRWQDAGATFIHVVDLDGAKKGSGFHDDCIRRIIQTVDVPIQVGGGIRSMADVQHKIGMGVSRIILGTAAIKSPDFVKEAVERYGDKIAVGIDAKDGKVATEAWLEVSEIDAGDLVQQMEAYGVRTIIYTDISRDGMMVGPNFDATQGLNDMFTGYIIASGGVSSMADLQRLHDMRIHGAIIGKALYNDSLDLAEVIALYEKG